MAGTDLFIPSLWSGALLKGFQKQMVYAALCNRDYEGEIKGQGDTVKILTLSGGFTVGDYVKNSTTISYETPAGTSQDLTIDQAKYFAFAVDDVDKYQSKPELLVSNTQLAGQDVADVVDQYVRDLMVAGAGITTNLGDDTTPLDINSAAVLSTFVTIAEAMDNANVPEAGRWIVIPPWFKKKLTLAKIDKDTNNSQTLANGFVGRYAGFDVYTSVNVKNTAGAKYKIVAGTNAATTFASQVADVESLRLETQFGTGIRGLYLYAGKVTRSTLALATCDEAAEA